RQREQARTDFERARAAVDKYLTEVSEDPELKSRNLEPLRRKLLQGARDYYERFVAEHPDDPGLLADLARAYRRLGQIPGVRDSPAGRIDPFQKKREVLERLHADHPDEPVYQSELAKNWLELGRSYHLGGKRPDAEDAFRRALALCDDLTRRHPDDPEYAL